MKFKILKFQVFTHTCVELNLHLKDESINVEDVIKTSKPLNILTLGLGKCLWMRLD